MTTLPTITAIYAALIGLLAAFLTVNVIRNRVGLKIEAGDGGNPAMTMAVRAHGNLAEHAPLVLLLIGIAEVSGSPKLLIHILGAALLLARLLSAWGLSHAVGPSFGRQSGAGLTVLTLLAASVTVLLRIGGII